jgi:hypothetical protein
MDGEKYQRAAASIRRAFRGNESKEPVAEQEQEQEDQGPGMFQSLADRISEQIRKRREKLTGTSGKSGKPEKSGK